MAERVFEYTVEGEKVVTEGTKVSMPSGEVERWANRQPLPTYSTTLDAAHLVARHLRSEVDRGKLPDVVWDRFENAVLVEGCFWKRSNQEAAELICRAALETLRSVQPREDLSSGSDDPRKRRWL